MNDIDLLTKIYLSEGFKPYAKGIRQILEGNFLENLDTIRAFSNSSLLTQFPDEKDLNLPSLAILTYGVNAENAILSGKSEDEVYGNVSYCDLRKKGLREVCRDKMEYSSSLSLEGKIPNRSGSHPVSDYVLDLAINF